MNATLETIAIEVDALNLTMLSAKRTEGVILNGERSANVSFSIDDAIPGENGSFAVATSYTVSFTNGDDEEFASLNSKYVLVFKALDREAEEPLSPVLSARLQLTAAEVTHPYHRETLMRLSQQFEVPSFDLPVVFPRDDFTQAFFHWLGRQDAAASKP